MGNLLHTLDRVVFLQNGPRHVQRLKSLWPAVIWSATIFFLGAVLFVEMTFAGGIHLVLKLIRIVHTYLS